MQPASKRPANGATRRWEKDPILSVQHLTMRFGGLVAVGDLSFDVGRGDITALIGPNGAGKTTVFNCVTGFYKPTEGRIVMRHGEGSQADLVERVTQSGEQYRREGGGAVHLLERMPDFLISHKAKVARTFQNIRLFGGMTVLENLLVAQHNPLMVASKFTFGGIVGIPSYREAEEAARQRAVYWLERVNLIERADDPAADLPYGAQRRLEIARAMCTGPQLLCLDEPAAGLNPRESSELNELLQYIRAEHGTSVLLIEHDMGVVMEISDHVVVLDYGEKIADGNAEEVRNDPKVIAAYLGVDDEAEIDIPEVREDIVKAERGARASAPSAGEDDIGAGGESGSEAGAPAPVPPRRPRSVGLEKTRHSPAARPSPAKASARAGQKPAQPKPPSKPARQAAAAPAPVEGEPRPPAAERPQQPDDLKLISGIGPKTEAILNGLGIWTFAQVAKWKKAERAWVDGYLRFRGRIEREDWVGQAKILAKGGDTEFSARSRRNDAGRNGPGNTGGSE